MDETDQTNRMGISAAMASQAELFTFLVSRGVIDKKDLQKHAADMIVQLDDKTPEGNASILPYKALLSYLSKTGER